MTDADWLARAAGLAEAQVGRTAPNPAVGAVCVRAGRVLGEGAHLRAGGPHAEVNCLNACAEDPAGATLYVTLEPCSTTGRTPPCCDLIKARGVGRVVIGCLDPNPRHAGRAVGILRAAGIAVRGEPIVYDPKLYVLRHTVAPAVLLEQGFHTNQGDVDKLKSAAYRRRLADAEARGIVEYLGLSWREASETDRAVAWAVDNGIMRGDGSGDLMLSEPVTRRQFDVMLWRYHQKFGG